MVCMLHAVCVASMLNVLSNAVFCSDTVCLYYCCSAVQSPCFIAFSEVDLPTVLKIFGEFFYHYTIERGFSEMLASLGRDLVQFLNGLDAQHYFLTTFIYGGIRSPSFRCEIMEDGSFLLHYYSTREGLHHVAIGE
jgi:hypothetical protein